MTRPDLHHSLLSVAGKLGANPLYSDSECSMVERPKLTAVVCATAEWPPSGTHRTSARFDELASKELAATSLLRKGFSARAQVALTEEASRSASARELRAVWSPGEAEARQ